MLYCISIVTHIYHVIKQLLKQKKKKKKKKAKKKKEKKKEDYCFATTVRPACDTNGREFSAKAVGSHLTEAFFHNQVSGNTARTCSTS